MGKIYCMSDIHGFYEEFARRLHQLDDLRTVMNGEDTLILLGDYIDGGPESGRVLRKIYEIQQLCGDNCIVLRGNQEEMLLEWLDTYSVPGAKLPGEYDVLGYDLWPASDKDFKTLRSLITEEQWAHLCQVLPTLSEEELNLLQLKMVMDTNRDLVRWLRGLPYFYETERQIFVHAGIDEEAGDWWREGTLEDTFVWKFPATMGAFEKDIVAGHIGTPTLMGDPDFHDVLWDGESHYFCDGALWEGGKLPVLVYHTDTGRYCSLGDDGLHPVARCPKERVKKWRMD